MKTYKPMKSDLSISLFLSTSLTMVKKTKTINNIVQMSAQAKNISALNGFKLKI